MSTHRRKRRQQPTKLLKTPPKKPSKSTLYGKNAHAKSKSKLHENVRKPQMQGMWPNTRPHTTRMDHDPPKPRPNKGLVTNYGKGGGYKTGGGAREVLPLRKGGAEKVLAMLKGAGTKSRQFLRGSLKF